MGTISEKLRSYSTPMRIGVLGGIGPEATAEFYSKFISSYQASGALKDCNDYPQIIVNSIPAPPLIYDQITDDELVPYINGLKELDQFSVDFIVMTCNTIHLYLDRLQKEIKTPILDLRGEVAKDLRKRGVSSTFIIGTPNTIKQGLYRVPGVLSMQPNQKEIQQLSDAIFSFNKGVDRGKQVHITRQICEKYLVQGAEAVILGCTEFVVMLGEVDGLPTINTIDVLVEATCKELIHLDQPKDGYSASNSSKDLGQ